MNYIVEKYPEEPNCLPLDKDESDSIRGNLVRKQQRLTRDLESINTAITALDASPDTAKVMELVFKANRV